MGRGGGWLFLDGKGLGGKGDGFGGKMDGESGRGRFGREMEGLGEKGVNLGKIRSYRNWTDPGSQDRTGPNRVFFIFEFLKNKLIRVPRTGPIRFPERLIFSPNFECSSLSYLGCSYHYSYA